jgi:D-glycero-D-manno-heptose 1,7-bisphosphate phosphatase
MIEDIGRRFSIELNKVYGIGDAYRDLQAFADASCKPILVRTGKGEETLAQTNGSDKPLPKGTLIFADLNEAVQHIIAEEY